MGRTGPVSANGLLLGRFEICGLILMGCLRADFEIWVKSPFLFT